MPLISHSTLDEIKAKLPVSVVVGRKVQLKRAGREMRGLSPFNAEKSPSFFCVDQKGFWHDFSSGKSGNIFDFVMETEGLSFPEAVETLAQEAGVTIEKGRINENVNAIKQLKTIASDVLTSTQGWLQDQFTKSIKAREYAASRGMDANTIKEFGVGYAPSNRFGLGYHLKDKCFHASAITASGVLVEGQDVAVPFAFLRDRLTFPIKDARGRIVSFGGRALGDDKAKYLNGRETPLYDKGRTLYNLDKASDHIRKAGHAIVLEGYIDVITVSSKAAKNCVAPLGTALTLEQAWLLWRLVPEIVLCFDGDAPGQRAAAKAIETLAPAFAGDRRLSFATLPSKSDPDSLVRHSGSTFFLDIIRARSSSADRMWQLLRAQAAGEGPDARTQAQALIAQYLEPIGDPQLKREYSLELTNRARNIGKRYAYQPQGDVEVDMGIPAREAALALAAAMHPTEYVEQEIERFAGLDFTAPIAAKVAAMVMACIVAGKTFDPDSLSRDLAVLALRVPSPAPSFVASINLAGFQAAIDLQVQFQQRRRLRSA